MVVSFEDVKHVIDTRPHVQEWVGQEFSGVDFLDRRLNRRFIMTAEALAKSPLSPINEACGDWARTRGAYRFFDNDKVRPSQILRPHQEQAVKRMAGHKFVLAVQDTVYLSYGKHPKTRGLGPVGSTGSTECGLVMHNAIAFSCTGVPLGILSQSIWARQKKADESRNEQVMRLQRTSIEDKESFKWITALRETIQVAPAGIKVVTVADRESDFIEFFAEATELNAYCLIRAHYDRQLVPEESCGFSSLLEALTAAPRAGEMNVQVLGKGGRKPRSAVVEVRFAEVTIKPPEKRDRAKLSAPIEPLVLNVISATEIAPIEGNAAVSWVLLTNLPVRNFAEASEKVTWYGQRWGIEVWHKVMKSGCKVEDCLLETADRLKRYLALFSVIALRLMRITYLARTAPDEPCTGVLSDDEWKALHVRVRRSDPKETPPTLKEAVRMIGLLGGHLGRSCDGEPGVTVLWRGWQRLMEDTMMWRIMKSFGNSS